MKKIGIVTPWFGINISGGAEALTKELAVHLQENGMKLEILTTCVKEFQSDWSKNYYQEGLTEESGIKVRRFKVRKRDTAAFDSVNYKLTNYKGKLTEQEEDLFMKEMIHSPRLYDFMKIHQEEYSLFVFIPYMFGTTYQGVQICPQKSVMIPCFHDESYIYLHVFQKVFSNVRGMIFLSQPECSLAYRVFDLKNVSVAVFGTGIDTRIEYDADRFRRKYGITVPYLICAGRKDAGKKVDLLLKYFALYKKRNRTNLCLVLIGGGKIEIPDFIKYDVYDLGFVPIEDKYDAFSASVALCNPSEYESFSLVIMESWLCNRPVLVNEACEVTGKFVKDAKGGLYFLDYFEFEGAVRYMERHPKEAAQMGSAGREYVRSHYDWKVIADQYIEYFEKIQICEELSEMEKL